jgi:hypothetical protein
VITTSSARFRPRGWPRASSSRGARFATRGSFSISSSRWRSANASGGLFLLRVVGGDVYWSRSLGPAAGGNTRYGIERWTPGAARASSIATWEAFVGEDLVAAEGLFWVDSSGGMARIMRSELDGTGAREIHAVATRATVLASDPEYVYWLEARAQLYRLAHAGGTPQLVAEPNGYVAFVCPQGDDLVLFGAYAWVATVPRAGGPLKILSADLNADGKNWFAAPGVDDFYVYWIDNHGDYWRVAR